MWLLGRKIKVQLFKVQQVYLLEWDQCGALTFYSQLHLTVTYSYTVAPLHRRLPVTKQAWSATYYAFPPKKALFAETEKCYCFPCPSIIYHQTGWTNINLLYLEDSTEIACLEGLTLWCPEINQWKWPLAWWRTIFMAWRQWPSTALQTLLIFWLAVTEMIQFFLRNITPETCSKT